MHELKSARKGSNKIESNLILLYHNMRIGTWRSLFVLTALLFIVSSLLVTYSVLLLEDSCVSPSSGRLPKSDLALQPDAGKEEGLDLYLCSPYYLQTLMS